MGSYQWYITKDREALLVKAREIAWREHKDLSVIIEELLMKWVQKTQKTHNPQTGIEDFEDARFKALPNIWSIEKPADLKEFSVDLLKEIMKHAGSVAYMASKRLEARGG